MGDAGSEDDYKSASHLQLCSPDLVGLYPACPSKGDPAVAECIMGTPNLTPWPVGSMLPLKESFTQLGVLLLRLTSLT